MNTNSVPSTANELTITGALVNALEMMDLAEMRVSLLRGHIFGDSESSGPCIPKTTIKAQVSDLSTRLAMLCGELATINTRVGCLPESCSAVVPEFAPQSQNHQTYSPR